MTNWKICVILNKLLNRKCFVEVMDLKALIFSDSHGRMGNMIEAAEREKDYDMVMFAGDVHRDIEEFMYVYPRVLVAEVIGNNDFFVKRVPEERVFEFGGKKILLTHGHKYAVKYSTAQLVAYAKRLGVDICVYGHTHCRDFERINGITVINPGAASRSYGVLTVDGDEISFEFKEI